MRLRSCLAAALAAIATATLAPATLAPAAHAAEGVSLVDANTGVAVPVTTVSGSRPCWGLRGLEMVVSGGGAPATTELLAVAPGLATTVLRRGPWLSDAELAPSCGRLIELHDVLDGHPRRWGGIVVRDADGLELFRLPIPGVMDELDIAWSPDETRFAIRAPEWGRPDTVRVLDATTGRVIRRYVPPRRAGLGALGPAAFSHDGRTLALPWAGENDRHIRLMHVASGRIRTLRVPAQASRHQPVAFSPKADVLAIDALGTPRILLLDATSRRVTTIDTRPALGGSELTWSPDGTQIAFTIADGGGDSGLMVVAARAGAPARVLAPIADGRAMPLAWSPDGRLIAYGREP